MKKSVVILIVIAFLIASSGCTRREGEPTEVNYRTGNQGLVLEFPTDTPNELYENDPNAKMVVQIRNQGAFPQHDSGEYLDGWVWVGGFDRNIMDLRFEENRLRDDELEGKSSYNPRGGYSAVVLGGPIFNLPEGMEIYEPRLLVTATYHYMTFANPIICIDPEPGSTYVKEKVCDVEDPISVSSQGAPIAVTRIEQHATHDNALFRIFIKNVDKGLVIDEYEIDQNPNYGYDLDSMNYVTLMDVNVGNERMTECRPSIGDRIKLIDGEGYIFCRFSTAGRIEAYTTSLNIKLSYGYTTSIERPMKIFEEVIY